MMNKFRQPFNIEKEFQVYAAASVRNDEMRPSNRQCESESTEETPCTSMCSETSDSTGRRDIKIVNKVFGRQNNNYYHKFINKSELDSNSVCTRSDESGEHNYKYDCFGCYKKKIKNNNSLTSHGTGQYYPSRRRPTKAKFGKRKVRSRCHCTKHRRNIPRREITEMESGSTTVVLKPAPVNHCHCSPKRFRDKGTDESVVTEETITRIRTENSKLCNQNRSSKHCHCSHKWSRPTNIPNVNRRPVTKKFDNHDFEVYNCRIVNSVTFGKNFKLKKFANDEYLNYSKQSLNCGDGSASKNTELKETAIDYKESPLTELNCFNYDRQYCSKIEKVNNTSHGQAGEDLIKNIHHTTAKIPVQNVTICRPNAIILSKSKKEENVIEVNHKSAKTCHTIITKPLLHSENSNLTSMQNHSNTPLLHKIDEIPDVSTEKNGFSSLDVKCSQVKPKYAQEDHGDCGDFCNDCFAFVERENVISEEEMKPKKSIHKVKLTVADEREDITDGTQKAEASHEQQVINPCGNIIFLVVEEPNCRTGCCYCIYRQCTTHGTTVPANRYTMLRNLNPLPQPVYPVSNGSSNFKCRLKNESNDKRAEVFYVTKEAHHDLEVSHRQLFTLTRCESHPEIIDEDDDDHDHES